MKNFKFALLAIAIAGSSMAMAQDKPAMVKQFLDLQRPGIEALARGLVEQSSAPIAQAGSQYLQTQVPAEKREAAAKLPTPSSRSTSTKPTPSCATRPWRSRRTR